MHARFAAAAATAALVLAGTTAPARAADATYPTGTFTLNSTSEYLQDNPGAGSNEEIYAYFGVTVSALSDDTTPMSDITITPDPVDDVWGPPSYHLSSLPGYIQVVYRQTGTFTPKVTLTDKDGNSTVIELGQVTVLPDLQAPTFTLTKPKHVHRAGAWHRIVGRYAETGVGLDAVVLQVLQKRHGVWWAYGYGDIKHPAELSWWRGKRTLAATLKFRRYAETYGSDNGSTTRWRTSWIPRITRGRLVLIAYAVDLNANRSIAKRYAVTITRR